MGPHSNLWMPEGINIDDEIEFIPLIRPTDRGNAYAYRTSRNEIIIVELGIDPGKKQPDYQKGKQHYQEIRFGPPPPEALPNLAWIIENQADIRGIFVTHGHLDHCGALPFLPARNIRIPVYGSFVTKKMAEKQAEMWNMRAPYFEKFLNGKTGRIQNLPFTVASFPVPHSIPQAKAFVIDINTGRKILRVMHLGEFKFNGMEENTRAMLERRLQEYAEERPIDLLTIDAIRADMEGMTPPKITVVRELERIIRETPTNRRVVVSFFASDFDFMKEIFRLANRLEKTVRLYGKSMKDNYEIGTEIGWWEETTPTLAKGREHIAIATGNQGERRSALDKAGDEEGTLEIKPNDVIVNFARPIPGNERQFLDMVERLLQRRATLYLDDRISLPSKLDERVRRARLHVSGHGAQEDIEHAIELIRPRHVVPLYPNAEGLEFFRRLAPQYGFQLVSLA